MEVVGKQPTTTSSSSCSDENKADDDDDDDNDAMSMSLYQFQVEKKSLCRAVSQEVVFEPMLVTTTTTSTTTTTGEEKGSFCSDFSEQDNVSNTSPKSTIMMNNHWRLQLNDDSNEEEENKDESLLTFSVQQEHAQQPQQQQQQKSDAYGDNGANNTRHVKAELGHIKVMPTGESSMASHSTTSPAQVTTPAVKKLPLPPSASCSPATAISTPSQPLCVRSPPPLLSPDVQQHLLEFARIKQQQQQQQQQQRRSKGNKITKGTTKPKQGQIIVNLESGNTSKSSTATVKSVTLPMNLSNHIDTEQQKPLHSEKEHVATTTLQARQEAYPSESNGIYPANVPTLQSMKEQQNPYHSDAPQNINSSLQQAGQATETTTTIMMKPEKRMDDKCSANAPGPDATTDCLLALAMPSSVHDNTMSLPETTIKGESDDKSLANVPGSTTGSVLTSAVPNSSHDDTTMSHPKTTMGRENDNKGASDSPDPDTSKDCLTSLAMPSFGRDNITPLPKTNMKGKLEDTFSGDSPNPDSTAECLSSVAVPNSCHDDTMSLPKTSIRREMDDKVNATPSVSPVRPKQSVVATASLDTANMSHTFPASPSRSRQTTSTASTPKSRIHATGALQVSPSRSRDSWNKESLTTQQPGLTNGMRLARQEGAHHVGLGDSFGVGLSRQNGSHHLVSPVQDGAPELDLKQPARPMKQPPLTIPDVARLPLADEHADDDLSSLSLNQPEPPLISDNKLKSLFQKAPPDYGMHHWGHANAPRGIQRPMGPIAANHPRGVPKTVRVGPPHGHAPHGIRNRLPGVMRQWTGAMVPEEILQHAEFANKMNQRRLRQKMMQQPPQAEKQPPAANIQRQRREASAAKDENDADDDLDLSNAASEDLGSFMGSPSFALASRVFHSNQRRPSDPSIDPEAGSVGGSRRRQSVMNKCIASADLNAVVSEPKASIARRSRLAAPQMAALGMRRRGLQKSKSKQVMLSTAALQQQSNRSGMSSVTMGSAVQEAVVKAHERPGLARSSVARSISIEEVILDNCHSTHSSVGWNSASNRTLDVSAHLLACAGLGGDSVSQRYNSELQPHLEGDNESTANQSRSVLDASSAVSPPSREEMRRRRASLRAEPPIGRRPSQQMSLPDGGIPTDAVSVASSRISAGPLPRRTSRVPNTSVPGLRHNRPAHMMGAESVPLNRGRNPDIQAPVPTPVPRGLKERFIAKIKEEREKEAETSLDGILNYQNDIVMEMACAMSKMENEKQVLAQQTSQLHMQKGLGLRMIGNGGTGKLMMESPGVLRSIGHLTAHPCGRPSSSHHGIEAPNTTSAPTNGTDSVEAAWRIALQESRHSGPPLTAVESETADPALRLALEASMQEFHPTPIAEDGSVEQALMLAIEQSKKESRMQLAQGGETDRALEIALEMSLAEAKEHDRICKAQQLYAAQEESLPEGNPEKVAPRSPESSSLQTTTLEGKRTLEVAMKLSKEEYDYEVSRRQEKQSGRQSDDHGEAAQSSGPSHFTGLSDRGSAVQNGARTLAQKHALGRRHNMNETLVMTSELHNSNEIINVARKTTPAVETGWDEALSLALAVSKVDVGATTNLSPEESMAYAMELSRRTPGAHSSVPSASQQPQRYQSSSPTRRDQPRPLPYYEEPRAPENYGPPHPLPYEQQGFLPHYYYSNVPQSCLPHVYLPPQPYYAPPVYHPPVPYLMPPYQPYIPPPCQPHISPAYPPAYCQPENRPGMILYHQVPSSSGSFGNTHSFSPTRAPEDDAALQLALELSTQDARNTKITSPSLESAASADEKSLALALELSRRER